MNVYETRGQPARVPTNKSSATEPKRGFRPPQHCPALAQVVSRKVQAAVPEQGMVRMDSSSSSLTGQSFTETPAFAFIYFFVIICSST